MRLSEQEKWGVVGALSLAALLILFWLIESGSATAVAIFAASVVTLLAAVTTAQLGIRGYRAQKKQDREEDLVKRRQQEYERYLTAFGTANRWSIRAGDAREQMAQWIPIADHWEGRIEDLQAVGGSAYEEAQASYDNAQRQYEQALQTYHYCREKHAEAEAIYHEAHSLILPVGSDQTMIAVNAFHMYYVDTEDLEPLETKLRYAKMIIAMRNDSFEETSLSVKDIARNIPWTVGQEPKEPINWDQINEGEERLS